MIILFYLGKYISIFCVYYYYNIGLFFGPTSPVLLLVIIFYKKYLEFPVLFNVFLFIFGFLNPLVYLFSIHNAILPGIIFLNHKRQRSGRREAVRACEDGSDSGPGRSAIGAQKTFLQT